MMHKVKIYVLIRNTDNRVFYVGKTIGSLRKRLANHKLLAREECVKEPKDKAKINFIRNCGMNISIRSIEEFEGDNADALLREKFWIDHYLSNGYKILNVACLTSYKKYMIRKSIYKRGDMKGVKKEPAKPVDIKVGESKIYYGSKQLIRQSFLLKYPDREHKIITRMKGSFHVLRLK